MKYFEGFECDINIPSVGADGDVHYTKVDKELANEAVYKGYMSHVESEDCL